MRSAAALLVLTLAAGCSSDTPPPVAQTPKQEVDNRIDGKEGNFILYVSNQSFERPTVDIAVWVDDVKAAGRAFKVEGQHTWIPFNLELEPGDHELRAVSQAGRTQLIKAFATGGRNWAVLNYWCCGEPDDPKFTFQTSDQPLAFG